MNLIPVIDLRRQYESMKDDIDGALRRVLESGWFVNGPETQAFEKEFASYCEAEECVGLGSGSAALNLTLRALGVGPGDEVITVSFTLSATLDAILDLGARPVLVDVTAATYTLDPGLLEAAITPRTKAILPVHIYGHPADMDAIIDIAKAHGLPVVSDACEAHGALYKGKQVAALGTASCFSFYPTKNLNALGDAGGVVTNDRELAERLRRLRVHGWDRRFHSAESSLNSRMDEFHAAVLREKLPHLAEWNARRIQIASQFDQALQGKSTCPASRADWAVPSYYLYVIGTPQRDEARKILLEAGITTDVHWPEPPHRQPAFANLGYKGQELAVTERLCDEVITIPIFPEMTDTEIERVCSALNSLP